MLQVGSRQGLNLTLWDTRADAEAASARTRAGLGPAPFSLALDEVYDVVATVDGPTPITDVKVCQVSWFDGPRSAAESEAMRRAGEQKIGPTVQGTAGHATTYVPCREADSAVVVVTMAASTDTLSRMAEAISITPLLAGEDPALLPGPDRIEVYSLEQQSIVATAVA